jgi:ATP/maltotriose-dependent transcriptional regulator MalT
MRQTRRGNPTYPGWKFESPRLGIHLLTRERLLGKVEQCLGRASRGGDILLVSAPAGYGKSTLLAEWALRTSLPVVWYHLDHSDQDPATFLRGIAHALKLRVPRPRWSVETTLDRLHADVLSDADLA